MAPSNLQGLNVVQTAATSRDYTSDSQDLLDFPTYREFNDQLDLWTNLTFQSDEPFLRKGEKRSIESVKPPASDDSADDDDEAAAKESDMLYPGDAHENIVTGIPVPNQSAPVHHGNTAHSRAAPAIPPPVDLASFLTSFGIDPFGLQAQQLQQNASNIPTFAQLFALSGGAAPQSAPLLTGAPLKPEGSTSPSAPKRARTTKSSTAPSAAASTVTSPTPETESPVDSNGTPVAAVEDKRRRNTAASARFRLKKKEREAALEKRAKELEVKVNELEKECEGLRRENGWLKGLVVGVTGGVTQQTVEVRSSAKRGREDIDENLDR